MGAEVGAHRLLEQMAHTGPISGYVVFKYNFVPSGNGIYLEYFDIQYSTVDHLQLLKCPL